MIEDKISYILVTESLSLVPLRPSRLIKMLRWTRAISFTLSFIDKLNTIKWYMEYETNYEQIINPIIMKSYIEYRYQYTKFPLLLFY